MDGYGMPPCSEALSHMRGFWRTHPRISARARATPRALTRSVIVRVIGTLYARRARSVQHASCGSRRARREPLRGEAHRDARQLLRHAGHRHAVVLAEQVLDALVHDLHAEAVVARPAVDVRA